MRSSSVLLFLAATLAANPVISDSGTRLSIRAQPAVVTVEPLPDGRRLLALPALEFELIIAPQCAPEMQADSISISVADTGKTLGSGDIDGQTSVATSITIPLRQISPLAVAGFCSASQSDDTTPTELLVKDAFTANVSLRCAGEGKQSIVYASQALSLSLQCHDRDDEPETPSNQEFSPTSIAR